MSATDTLHTTSQLGSTSRGVDVGGRRGCPRIVPSSTLSRSVFWRVCILIIGTILLTTSGTTPSHIHHKYRYSRKSSSLQTGFQQRQAVSCLVVQTSQKIAKSEIKLPESKIPSEHKSHSRRILIDCECRSARSATSSCVVIIASSKSFSRSENWKGHQIMCSSVERMEGGGHTRWDDDDGEKDDNPDAEPNAHLHILENNQTPARR